MEFVLVWASLPVGSQPNVIPMEFEICWTKSKQEVCLENLLGGEEWLTLHLNQKHWSLCVFLPQDIEANSLYWATMKSNLVHVKRYLVKKTPQTAVIDVCIKESTLISHPPEGLFPQVLITQTALVDFGGFRCSHSSTPHICLSFLNASNIM